MEKTIGVGIVGLSASGRWAATAHVPALRAVDGFEIRALTASTPQSAKSAAERFGIPFHSHITHDLVTRPDVDLIVVTVRLPQHRELVGAALDAGKMVYCEWPLGNGLDESRELAQRAERMHVRTFIGLQGRAAPPVRYIRDLVAEGFVGEVLSTTLVASLGLPWAGEVNQNSLYLLDEANGATMLSIPFAHTLDAIGTVLGGLADASAVVDVRRNSARVIETGDILPMSSPDQIALSGHLENGTVISVHYRAAGMRSTGLRWEINGRDGDILIEGENGHMQYGRLKIFGARGKDTALSPMPVPEKYHLVDLPRDDLSYTVAHAYSAVRQDLLKGTRTVPDFAYSLAVHAMVETIKEAGRSGRRCTFTLAERT